MRSESRLVYIADDGQEFDSAPACLLHEAVKELATLIENNVQFNQDFEVPDAEDIAKALLTQRDAVQIILTRINQLIKES